MGHVTIEGFADKMNEIIPAIGKGFMRQQANELSRGRITMPQFLILDHLEREGESTMTNLAHFTNVTTAAMTGFVERLVRDGYVKRGFDSRDRRIIKVSLTAKGRLAVKEITHQRTESIKKVFGRISELDRLNYLRILMKIKDIVADGAISEEKKD